MWTETGRQRSCERVPAHCTRCGVVVMVPRFRVNQVNNCEPCRAIMKKHFGSLAYKRSRVNILEKYRRRNALLRAETRLRRLESANDITRRPRRQGPMEHGKANGGEWLTLVHDCSDFMRGDVLTFTAWQEVARFKDDNGQYYRDLHGAVFVDAYGRRYLVDGVELKHDPQ